MADLDRAVGGYVRGIFLECALLGLTVALFLTIVGVPLRWAIAIGLFAGATNMVPYVGFVVAVLGGLGYVLLAEEIQPLLPMVDMENVWIWVIVAVGLAELLKNVIYEPVVLGACGQTPPARRGDRRVRRRHLVRRSWDAARDSDYRRLQSLRLEHSEATQSRTHLVGRIVMIHESIGDWHRSAGNGRNRATPVTGVRPRAVGLDAPPRSVRAGPLEPGGSRGGKGSRQNSHRKQTFR